MGLNKLSDEEIKKIITELNGVKKILQDPENVKRFFGIDSEQKEQIADILKPDLRMSDEE